MSIVPQTVLARAMSRVLSLLFFMAAMAGTGAAAQNAEAQNAGAQKAKSTEGVWLAIVTAPAKSPLGGARVAINGKDAGLSDSKGLVFIAKKRIFAHNMTVTVAKEGYQTTRQRLVLTPKPKSQRNPAYRISLAEIPARLGHGAPGKKTPLVGPFPPSPKSEHPLAKLQRPQGTAVVTTGPVAPRYRLAELPKKAAQTLAVLPRRQTRADIPQPLLTIKLREKPGKRAKAGAKANPEKNVQDGSDRSSTRPLPYAGAVGRLVYAQPKGLVAYCDLSRGRCTFPLSRIRSAAAKGLRPKQLTITGDGIKTRTMAIRSAKSQTVLVTIERLGLSRKKTAQPSTQPLGAFATSYDALADLGRPAIYAADGELSPKETANLLRYGTTVKPVVKKKRRKGQKAKGQSKDQGGGPSLGWRDVRVESPGHVATTGGNRVERAFATRAYTAPKVALVTMGMNIGSAAAHAKTISAIDKAQLAKAELRWLPQRELKAELARRGRALTAWLGSSLPAPAADFVVILATIKGGSPSFLALLQHRATGEIIAAKTYAKNANVAKAVDSMVGHIPYEVTAIASKDGDIALNLPKALFSRLASKTPDAGAQKAAMTLRLMGPNVERPMPIALEATRSYPRLTYFSALSIAGPEGIAGAVPAGTRIRVGQRFVLGLTEHRLPLATPAAGERLIPLKGKDGKALAHALIWTADGVFMRANERGEVAKALAGFYHPSYGAYSARLNNAAPRLIAITTVPVPARIIIAGKELGTSPLALYPSDAALSPRSAAAITITPLGSAPGSKANAYSAITANASPARLLAKQGYALELSPDHRARIEALIAANKLTEAERYLKTLPRKTRTSYDFRFFRAAIKAKQGQHKACYGSFRQLTRLASQQKAYERLAASAINESVCLSQLIRKKPALKSLRQTLASLQAAEKKAGKTSRHLPAIAFYSSHLKYLHWQATGKKSFLDDAVRGYRYYLTMTAPKSASDERLASFKIEAKKVIAMAEQ